MDTKSILKEDQLFVQKREIFIKRIQTQQNNFGTQYKIFNPDFEFQGRPFKDWISNQLAMIQECKEMMEQVKRENPKQAAEQELRKIDLTQTEKRFKDHQDSKESGMISPKQSNLAEVLVQKLQPNGQTRMEIDHNF